MEKYILIDEYNSEKGESFGVAFEATEENQNFLCKITGKYEDHKYGDNQDDYRAFSANIVDHSELLTLEKFDNNHYMDRITWAKSDRGLQLLAEIATTLPYKTTCAYIDAEGRERYFHLENGLVAHYDSALWFPGLSVWHTVDYDKWFVMDSNTDEVLFTGESAEDVKQFIESKRKSQ